jgi:hypothetical protein
VVARGEECAQSVAGLRDRVGPRYRDGIEAERARLLVERAFESDRIAQKSRSA